MAEFFKSRYSVIWLIFSLSLSFLQGSYGSDSESLSNFIHDYANSSLRYPRTGIAYNLSLPANFSGMEASFARFFSAKFYSRGLNFSSFYIPPRVITMPYVRRLAIVYENLGNWSSVYYQVTNYTLVAPVVGLLAYDSNSSATGTQKINFSIQGDPIAIRFPYINLQGQNATPKCVKFGAGGSIEMKNMTETKECLTNGEGHFSVVIPIMPTPTPTPTPRPRPRTKKKERWKGVVGGISGLILLGLAMIVVYRLVKRRQMRAMEKQSEKDVAFNTFWVGGSKMPSASMTRTQPKLENEYAAS